MSGICFAAQCRCTEGVQESDLGLLVCAGPHLGAQFAQLVKELRSEYAAAVTACAERIAGALFQRPGYSINATLHRHGISGTPSIMQQQVLLIPYASTFERSVLAAELSLQC